MMSSPFGATRIAVALMVVVMLALPHSGRAQTAIIVNRSNPVASLSLDDLRRLYLGTSTTFSNSVPVSLLEMTGLRASFYKSVLGMSEDRVSRHWIAVVFAGQHATPPKSVADAESIKQMVARTTGAIAFIPIANVDATVKVLAIEARLPSDPVYPIR